MEKDPQWCVCKELVFGQDQHSVNPSANLGVFAYPRKKVQFRDHAANEVSSPDSGFPANSLNHLRSTHLFRAHKKLHLGSLNKVLKTWGLDENVSYIGPGGL